MHFSVFAFLKLWRELRTRRVFDRCKCEGSLNRALVKPVSRAIGLRTEESDFPFLHIPLKYHRGLSNSIT